MNTLSDFYVTGGNLAADAQSYIPRKADVVILEKLRQRKTCYILTTRQIGKSSLIVRALHRLRDSGVASALVELSHLGSGLTDRQWYVGLLGRLAFFFQLEDEMETFIKSHEALSPMLVYL